MSISQDYINDCSENYLSNYLTCSRLSTDFPKHEKRAYWDGSIFLYKNQNRNKEGMERIPIQLKGTTCNFNGKYSFSKDELLAYKSENGIIFFLVKMFTNNENQIIHDKAEVYFVKLSRDVIDRALSKICDNKTINIELKILKREDAVKECRKFLYTRNSYNNFETIEDSDFDKIEKITIPSFDINESMSDIFFKEDRVVALAQIRGRSKQKIINLFNFIESHTIKENVSIDNVVFYNQYTIQYDKDHKYIIFDECTKLIAPRKINAESCCVNLNINFSTIKTINEGLRHTKFLSTLLRKKYVKLGNKNLDFNNCDFDLKLVDETNKVVQEVYSYLTELDSFTKTFNLPNQIINNLTNNEFELIKRINSQKPTQLTDIDYNYCIYDIGPYSILTKLIYISNNTYIIANAFDYLDTIEELSTSNGQIFKLPLILHLGCKTLLEIDNIDFEKINYTIEQLNFSKKIIQDFSACWLLQLIKAYDNCNNSEFLYSANKLCNKFKEHNFQLYLINETQIKVRLGEDVTDNCEIISNYLQKEKKKKNYNCLFDCCAQILLQNNYEVKKSIKKLTETELNQLKEWPIYKLYEENN